MKDAYFQFNEEYMKAFNILKWKLVYAFDCHNTWLVFSICGASDIVGGAILYQMNNMLLHVTYYSSHVLIPTKMNHARTQK